MSLNEKYIAIVPAAGVGKRMGSSCPKQYLRLNGQTIIYHTVTKLLSHPLITKVVVALNEEDQYFADSGLADHKDIIRVKGGVERVDSVLNGLKAIKSSEYSWVLVHDAARPCVSVEDIDRLIKQCSENNCGGILATPVRDTMKRGSDVNDGVKTIKHTVEREQLWHALTPQMYRTTALRLAIETGLAQKLTITDEASAVEHAKMPSLLVAGSIENIKITHPNDLALAEFYLNKQMMK